MGIAALNITEGISILNMKVFLVSTLASLAMAMPGEINNVNRVSGFLNPSWVGAWPDSAVEVAYPSHTASWPGATVSVTRGKRSAGGFTVEGNQPSQWLISIPHLQCCLARSYRQRHSWQKETICLRCQQCQQSQRLISIPNLHCCL